jgi:hypothetical protein
MVTRIEPWMDIGLRHALETGLALVRPSPTQKSEPEERIIANLIEILSEARRGSQAVQRNELLTGVRERPAFERFALFFRYLRDTIGDELPTRLEEAASVFEEVKQRKHVDPKRQERTAELIDNLLKSVRREAALSRPVAPRTIVYE